jgi:hypothetical protein
MWIPKETLTALAIILKRISWPAMAMFLATLKYMEDRIRAL